MEMWGIKIVGFMFVNVEFKGFLLLFLISCCKVNDGELL